MSAIGRWLLERAESDGDKLVVDLTNAPKEYPGDRRYAVVAIRLGLSVLHGS